MNEILSNRPRLYDSRPYIEHTMEVISAHLDHLTTECQSVMVNARRVAFSDIFADTIIRCANDLSLDGATDDVIIARFVYLFRTTNTCYCKTLRDNLKNVGIIEKIL